MQNVKMSESMREKPIIFSTQMVRAILNGHKTQTRRVITPKRHDSLYCIDDILWVRESWARVSDWTVVDPDVGLFDGYIYKSDWDDNAEAPKWRPSIYLPREVARLFLRVTDVHGERLQDISETDAQAEGVNKDSTYKTEFCRLWESLNAKRGYGWNENPWVWKVVFEVVKQWND